MKDMTCWQLTILDGAPPTTELGSLAAGDLDGDGHNEIVTGGMGALLWYRPDTFEKGTIASGKFVVGLALADLRGGGKLDVLAGGQDGESGKNVLWCFWMGDDLNSPWQRTAIDPAATGSVHDVIAVDVDGDGELEVVANAAYSANPGLFIYKRTADPARPWTKHVVSTGIFSEGLAAADLDGDGQLELVHGPDWFKAPAAGPLSGPWTRHVYAPGFREMCRTAVADITGSGRPDLVICESEYPDGRISWFENRLLEDPEHPWLEHSLDPEDAPLNFAHSLWAQGEGKRARLFVGEMAAGGWGQPYNFNARLLGYATADNGRTWKREVIARGQGTHQAFLFDVDKDGELEVLGKEWGNARCLPRVHIWKQQEKPSPLAGFRHELIDRDKPGVAVDILPADVDGDGRPDVICGAWWYRYPTWQRYTIPGVSQVLNAVDLDGDGRCELIAMKRLPGQPDGALSSTLCWLKAVDPLRGEWELHDIGTGDEKEWVHSTAIAPLLPGGRLGLVTGYHRAAGGDHPPHLFEIPEDPTQSPWPKHLLADIPYGEEIVAFDLDGDGLVDLVAGNYWIRNLGDGTFEAHKLADVPGIARIRVLDVNGDGRPDIVFVQESVDYHTKVAGFVPVGWLENPGDPLRTPWPIHVIDKLRSPHSVEAADLDGDGELEIVVGEHDPFSPYRSRSRLVVYKKAEPHAGAWHQVALDGRFEHHDGTKAMRLADGRTGIISHGWKDSRYVHLWVK